MTCFLARVLLSIILRCSSNHLRCSAILQWHTRLNGTTHLVAELLRVDTLQMCRNVSLKSYNVKITCYNFASLKYINKFCLCFILDGLMPSSTIRNMLEYCFHGVPLTPSPSLTLSLTLTLIMLLLLLLLMMMMMMLMVIMMLIIMVPVYKCSNSN